MIQSIQSFGNLTPEILDAIGCIVANSLGPFHLQSVELWILCSRTRAVEDHHECCLRPSESAAKWSFFLRQAQPISPANSWLMLVRLHTIHQCHSVVLAGAVEI